MSEDKVRGSGQVRSLTRALRLMRHLSESGDGMTLTELSEAASLPPSTVHRLLTTLESERFVRPDSNAGVWRIGVSAFIVGASFARSRDKLNMMRPYLKRLMELSGETANLYVASEGDAVCIGQIESRHAMRALTGVGGRIALHSSAAGKVLLAYLDENDRETRVSVLDFARLTERTISDAAGLHTALASVRELGYAVDDEEHDLGLRCVAAPIFDEHGHPVAAVSVSGPSARIVNSRLAALGRMVAQAAQEATRDFGGSVPIAAQ